LKGPMEKIALEPAQVTEGGLKTEIAGKKLERIAWAPADNDHLPERE